MALQERTILETATARRLASLRRRAREREQAVEHALRFELERLLGPERVGDEPLLLSIALDRLRREEQDTGNGHDRSSDRQRQRQSPALPSGQNLRSLSERFAGLLAEQHVQRLRRRSGYASSSDCGIYACEALEAPAA